MGMILFTPKKRNVVTPKNYGALYNWYAASKTEKTPVYDSLYNRYTLMDERGICPAGYRVATREDFETLFATLGLVKEYDTGEGGAYYLSGGKLKETGYTHWDSPNEGATNEIGFNYKGNGLRYSGGFYGLKQFGTIYTTSTSGGYFWTIETRYDMSHIGILPVGSQTDGYGVRWIKENSTNDGFVSDYDGNIYTTIKIGDQVWATENARVSHYNNGEVIPNITDNTSWNSQSIGAMCNYNNNVANSYIDTGNPLIAEGDFVVPNNSAFGTLITYSGGNPDCGIKLIESGIAHWVSPNTIGNNSLNFSGVGSGSRDDQFGTVSFIGLGHILDLWSTDFYIDYDLTWGYKLFISYVNTPIESVSVQVTPNGGSPLATNGESIRLFRLATESELLLSDGSYCADYIDYDLNHYKTVKIGTQVWMAENLKTTHYSDGSLIPLIEDNTAWAALTTGARCSYNNDDSNL